MSKQEQLADALARLASQSGSADDAIMVGLALGLTLDQMSDAIDRLIADNIRKLETVVTKLAAA